VMENAGELVLTLLMGVASALIPVVNAEAYLGGLVLAGAVEGGWQLSAVAGVASAGQMAGKTLYYLAGRDGSRLVAVLRRRFGRAAAHKRLEKATTAARTSRPDAAPGEAPEGPDSRWRRGMQRPGPAIAVVGCSAVCGFPPFAVISVLAGTVRVHLPIFLMVGLAGRWVRFAVVLAGVSGLRG
jgi:membrane protein YqaA with SNARE-associated domain